MTFKHFIATVALLVMAVLPPVSAARKGGTFTVGDKTFLLNGKPFVVKAAGKATLL